MENAIDWRPSFGTFPMSKKEVKRFVNARKKGLIAAFIVLDREGRGWVRVARDAREEASTDRSTWKEKAKQSP